MTEIPLCSLCANPLHQTANGGWVCPLCDCNVPRQFTRKDDR
jgi:uncharacterized Zn finger protein (UPF0148 family)